MPSIRRTPVPDWSGFYNDLNRVNTVFSFSLTDEKKKAKLERAAIVCCVCKKILNTKHYTVRDSFNTKIRVCSNCKILYDVFYREMIEEDNIDGLGMLFEIAANSQNIEIAPYQKTRKVGIFIKPSEMYKIKSYSTQDIKKMYKKCCKSCEKQFTSMYTRVKWNTHEIRICRNCEYVLKTLIQECQANNTNTLQEIFAIIWRRKERGFE